MKIKYLLGLLIIPMLSCSKGGGDENTPNEDYYNIALSSKDVSDGHISDYFEISKVVPLQTSEQSLIGGINGLIFKNNLIYILDGVQKQILVFDESGRNVGRLKAIGNGPHEYVSLGDFDVYDDKIYVSDMDQGKFIAYNADYSPDFEKGALKDLMSFCMLGKNKLVNFSGNHVQEETKISNTQYNNLVFRDLYKIENSFLPFHISHEGRIFRGGSSNSTFSQSGDSLYYINSSSMEVYKISEKGNPMKYLKIDAHDADFDEATMPLEQYMEKVREPGKPRFLNTLTIDNTYIYYQFFIDKKSYRGLYLRELDQNNIFEWNVVDKNFGVQLNGLQYKGDGKGLVFYIDPAIEKSRNNISRPEIITKYLKQASDEDNPILLFMNIK